jgi:hypothetical protein
MLAYLYYQQFYDFLKSPIPILQEEKPEFFKTKGFPSTHYRYVAKFW